MRGSSAGGVEHSATAYPQRGSKRQPAGGFNSDGGWPGIWGSRSGRASSSRAIEPSSPQV